MKRIAFYAPIKPPDHPIPSGDRLIAGNLMQALTLAGYDARLASRFITYSKRENSEILTKRKEEALMEAKRIIQRMRGNPPDLWLTYHPYCKAPDWIGPTVSGAFAIPYVTVEAARTGQGLENGGDRWKAWRDEAQVGIRQADLHICLKPLDRFYLGGLLGSEENLRDLRPFFDATEPSNLPEISLPSHWRKDVPVLVVAGMMRPGKKVENYRILAEALTNMQALPWNLVIIGGGPEEDAIRELFKNIATERLYWTRSIPREEVLAYMAQGDLFVWPGWREPIGMVYLEAQLMGLPVAALNDMGVPLVVKHGKTGLLAEDKGKPYEDALTTLISHPQLRHDLARQARENAISNHGMDAAAQRLKSLLDPLLFGKPLPNV
ncbi:glycosyltransferase family 4 protein [Pseudahrensia aquimaris]|uniref:Glycosyltransferase family 4 protein n=1 Tax=Pseudahrensia aquimaris TaxID=744461 RepID=A0ABW3FDS5_9HYPH